MIDETVDEIRRMETHSSSVVALRAARALRDLLDREFVSVDEFERSLERNSSALRRANPSHASLFTTQRDIVEAVVGEADTVDAGKDRLREAIESVIASVERAKASAADTAAATFDDGETILTHDYSSTLLGAVERAAADRAVTAYVTEARPRYLGRKTARALADIDGVETHLSVDGAAGHLLDRCDRVVVGMDCIVEDTLYNRVGTYPIAAAAADAGVPVHVVGSSAKVIDAGFVFENEFRPGAEVSLEPLDGVEIENPAYDATPTRLVDAVLTDEGRIEP